MQLIQVNLEKDVREYHRTQYASDSPSPDGAPVEQDSDQMQEAGEKALKLQTVHINR